MIKRKSNTPLKNRIAYKNIQTGEQGHSQWFEKRKEYLAKIAEELNIKDKDTHHWVESEDDVVVKNLLKTLTS